LRATPSRSCHCSNRFTPWRADVFNVFNTQQALDFNEFGEIDIGAYPGPGQRDLNYRQITAYQTPRFVRLSASIEF
jgi:hypothetical protein